MAEEWLDRQNAAKARQLAAHGALANGSDTVPAAEDGPLSRYTRAQTLDYIAQQTDVAETGTYLPNASGPGLTVLPGTERLPVDAETRKKIVAKVAELTEAGAYTADELAEASARLAANLEDGVSLDPTSAEN